MSVILVTVCCDESLPGHAIRLQRRGARARFHGGRCPLDEQGRVVAPGDLQGQARRAVENLLTAMSRHSVGAESLLKTTVFVVAHERSDLVMVWDVVSSRLG